MKDNDFYRWSFAKRTQAWTVSLSVTTTEKILCFFVHLIKWQSMNIFEFVVSMFLRELLQMYWNDDILPCCIADATCTKRFSNGCDFGQCHNLSSENKNKSNSQNIPFFWSFCVQKDSFHDLLCQWEVEFVCSFGFYSNQWNIHPTNLENERYLRFRTYINNKQKTIRFQKLNKWFYIMKTL